MCIDARVFQAEQSIIFRVASARQNVLHSGLLCPRQQNVSSELRNWSSHLIPQERIENSWKHPKHDLEPFTSQYESKQTVYVCTVGIPIVNITSMILACSHRKTTACKEEGESKYNPTEAELVQRLVQVCWEMGGGLWNGWWVQCGDVVGRFSFK